MPSGQLKLNRTPHNPFFLKSAMPAPLSQQQKVKYTECQAALLQSSLWLLPIPLSNTMWSLGMESAAPQCHALSWKISSWSWLLQSKIGFVEESLGTILHGRRHLGEATAVRCSHSRKNLGMKTGKRTNSGAFHSFGIV